jgi:hypothetical protein
MSKSDPAALPPAPDASKDATVEARPRKVVLQERLDRLGVLAMELAEKTQLLAMLATERDLAAMQAAPADSPAIPCESNGPVLSFARTARIARDCIALELRITEPGGADDDDRRMSPAARRRINAMKNEVRQHVERSIRSHADPLAVDRMLLDLDQRLDNPEVEAEFGVLTIGQMVLSVCRDLNVKADLTHWPEDMLQTALAAALGVPAPPPAAPHHGMTVGMKADPTVQKLPTGIIGSPGVPPAMDLPQWSDRAPPLPHYPPGNPPKPPPPPDPPRRHPGASFAR